MSDATKLPNVERTAEERRIRELHKHSPIRELPAGTITGADVAGMLKFVAAVRREREAQGLSVEQLAERAGVDAAALARFEAGQAFNPSASTLFRLARALGKNLALTL